MEDGKENEVIHPLIIVVSPYRFVVGFVFFYSAMLCRQWLCCGKSSYANTCLMLIYTDHIVLNFLKLITQKLPKSLR